MEEEADGGGWASKLFVCVRVRHTVWYNTFMPMFQHSLPCPYITVWFLFPKLAPFLSPPFFSRKLAPENCNIGVSVCEFDFVCVLESPQLWSAGSFDGSWFSFWLESLTVVKSCKKVGGEKFLHRRKCGKPYARMMETSRRVWFWEVVEKYIYEKCAPTFCQQVLKCYCFVIYVVSWKKRNDYFY